MDRFDYVCVNKKLFRSTQNQRKCQTFIMFIDIWEITCTAFVDVFFSRESIALLKT